jgi:hypothetical protein
MATTRAWFTIGAVATVAVLGYAGWQGVTWLLPQQTDEQHQTYHQQVGKVELDFNAGSATLLRGQDGQVDVDQKTMWSLFAKPTVQQTWEGDTLHISVRCPDGSFLGVSDRCSADFSLRIPANVTVDARTEAGSLRVKDTTGDTKLSTTAGDIEFDNTSGKLSAQTNAGSVTGTGLRSTDVTVSMDVGSADLQFAVPPHLVDAEVSAGDLQIAVPKAPYQVQAHADSSPATVDFTPDPAATSKIIAQTHAGDVHVRYAN